MEAYESQQLPETSRYMAKGYKIILTIYYKIDRETRLISPLSIFTPLESNSVVTSM